MIPSPEQQHVITCMKEWKNISVNAVAGSGKSTVVMMAAKQLTERRILAVTYNSLLRKEFQEKVTKMSLTNLEIHTYHSLAVAYYSPSAWNDLELQRVVAHSSPPTTAPLPLFDTVVLDEIQDMTMLYFRFVVKFLHDMCQNGAHKFQLVILGDTMQGLYEFKGSDVRFLTCAPSIWLGFALLRRPDTFEECQLQVSYRITTPMAAFVNRVMLGEERLLAQKTGVPVRYLRKDNHGADTRICHMIKDMIKHRGYVPEDFFILAGSVRTANIARLENTLVMNGIPCYVPWDVQDKIDEKVIKHKLAFSTFHSVKGRQRKVAIVVGYDNSYFEVMARNLDRKLCPNTLYVACTRATEFLCLVESSHRAEDRPLEFLKLSHLEMKQQDYMQFEGLHQTIFYNKKEEYKKSKEHNVSVTNLVKFMSEDLTAKCALLVEKLFRKIHTEVLTIEIPTMVETAPDHHEDVSDLNGMVIPAIYFSRMFEGRHHEMFYEIVTERLANMKPQQHLFLRDIVEKRMPRVCESVSDFLFSACIYAAVSDGYYSRINQLHTYEWLTEQILQDCVDRMNAVMFEGEREHDGVEEVEMVLVETSHKAEQGVIEQALAPFFDGEKFRFTARVDVVTQHVLWELKCTSEMNLDHYVQLMVYAWLWRTLHPERPKEFRLFNIKTGEHYLLQATYDELTDVVVDLLRGKYWDHLPKTDEDFLTVCLRNRDCVVT